MNYESILFEIDDRGVCTLTLNQPDRHNCLSDTLIAEVRSAINVINDSTEIRVVILTGAGDTTFCAGGDLKWMEGNLALSRQQRIEQASKLAVMFGELNSLKKPLIGRLNGSAFGGGTGMIAVCDYTIAVSTAKYCLTEVKLGLIAATISPYVVRRMGEPNARRTFLNAKMMTADEAQKYGLVSEVVSPEQLDETIEKEIQMFLRCAPGAIAMTKELIAFVSSHEQHDNFRFTADRLADAWETEEGKAGIEAFLAKKKPYWQQ